MIATRRVSRLLLLPAALFALTLALFAADINGTTGNDNLFFVGTQQTVSTTLTNPYSLSQIAVSGEYNVNSATYEGFAGLDTIFMTNVADLLLPEVNGAPSLSSVERLIAGDGRDVLDIASNTFVLGNTQLEGGAGDDLLWGNSGDDTLNGSNGNDIIDGGPGNDTLNGQNDDDLLFGGAGNDTISGLAGINQLFGGPGSDLLQTTTGSVDFVAGGGGFDTLTVPQSGNTISRVGANEFRIVKAGVSDVHVVDVERLSVGPVDLLPFDASGPITSALTALPAPVAANQALRLGARIDDGATGGTPIASAWYEVWDLAGNLVASGDGSNATCPSASRPCPLDALGNPDQAMAFDAIVEDVQVTIPDGTLAPGLYTACIRGTDANGASVVGAFACSYVAVHSASGHVAAGGGQISNNAAFCTLNGLCASSESVARFAFASKYTDGGTVPAGPAAFAFAGGNLDFRSSAIDTLEVAGAQAQYEGSGTINRLGDYGFRLTVADSAVSGGPATDTVRIEIWDKTSSAVIYDNGAGQTVQAGDVTIVTLNSAPAASDDSLGVTEDEAATGTLHASDEDSATLTFSIVANGTNGTALITDTATGAYTYTPNANVTGSDSFTFKANDGSLDSNVATISVTIDPVNDAPVATDDNLGVTEDLAAAGTLSATDGDSGSLTFSIVTNGTKGTALITNTATGAYTYTPNANATGSDTFTFKANDGDLDSNTATIKVTLDPVNDAPVVGFYDDQTAAEGAFVSLAAVEFTDPEPTDTHTATINWGDGTAAVSALLSESGGVGSVSGSHAFSDNGVFTVTVSMTDSAGALGVDTFIVTVSNVRPTVADISPPTVSSAEPFDLDAAFSDPGFGDTFVGSVAWGDGTSTAGGDLTLTHTAGSPGVPTSGSVQAQHHYSAGVYTVTVCVTDDDGDQGCRGSSVTVQNAVPTATNASIAGTPKVGQLLTGGYTYGDVDGDGQGTSTFRWLRDGGAIGGATASTYTVVVADLGASITFEVTPVAATGSSPGAAATSDGITILNSAPTATGTSISGTPKAGELLTGNYSYGDVDGDAEATSTFRWLRNNVAIGGATSSTYTVVTDDRGTAITFEVTPVAATGTSPGSPVTSDAVAVPAAVPTTTTVLCPSSETYTGGALTPCSVSVTSTDGLSLSPSPLYANNTDVGSASASYFYPGDATYLSSDDTEFFAIDPASSTVAVSCGAGPFTYTGAAQTPCTASVTGAGLNQSLSVSYQNNVNAGTATASASFAGDGNHTGDDDSTTFAIGQAPSTTTVSNRTVTSSASSQVVSLSAQVAGSIVPDGLVTFTVKNGATTIGVPVSGSVIGGTATANYTLPGGTSAGNYTIAAAFNGSVNYANSQGAGTLTVSPSSTVRPDLVVTKVNNPPPKKKAGESFDIEDTTTNTGSVAAGASTTRYRLSLDATITGTDPLLTGARAVPGLAAGAKSTGKVQVLIPVSLAPGKYYVAACADDLAVVAESNETNNCRVADKRLEVERPRK